MFSLRQFRLGFFYPARLEKMLDLFQNRLDPSDAGRGSFFLNNFKMT